MKKRLFSLALTLALCLGLITPTIAADTSGLDATSAQAYHNVLTKEIQEKGIRDKLDGHGIAYAGLEDLNADGKPELIVISFVMDWRLDIGIWTMKNGAAVSVSGGSSPTGIYNGRVAFARKNGQTRLFYDYYWSYRTLEGRDIALIDGNGNSESDSYINSGDGNRSTAKDVTYDKTWIVDSTPILKVENSLNWEYSDSQPQAVKDMQSSLLAQATTPSPAAGTYGPYTITGVMYDGSPYKVSFSAAKVEQKTVQIREYYDIGGDYSSYQNETVTLVTIRPDTNVTVSSNFGDGVPVEVGKVDGNNKYTQMVLGAAQYIHNGIGKQSFEWDLTPDFVRLGDYLICEDATAYTNGGFMDVKAGAYYEDAVKWAVDKKITSGTSATIFSPDSTCTVAQILTFLWRANGSLRPTVRNPFSDISSNDYFYEAAIWAYEKGLIPDTGYFLSKNEPCTRKMVAYFLWKLAGAPTSIPSGQYVAQNITVEDDGTCYLRFSGATLKETTITEHVPIWADDGPEVVGWRNEPAKVTLITMRPGSTVTVNTPHKYDGGDNISGNAYSITSDGKYHDMTWNIPASVYTGAVENAFQYSIGNIEDAGQTAVKLYSWVDLDKGVYKIYMLQMTPVSTKFTDVSANAYYAQAVVWAVNQEITAGTSDTTFSPNAICTRGQIVTFLYRAMGK